MVRLEYLNILLIYSAWSPPTQRNVVDVMYATIGTIPGDVNGDFNVNIMDGAALAYAFDSHAGDPLWNLAADFAHTGTIGILDTAILAAYYGTVA